MLVLCLPFQVELEFGNVRECSIDNQIQNKNEWNKLQKSFVCISMSVNLLEIIYSDICSI